MINDRQQTLQKLIYRFVLLVSLKVNRNRSAEEKHQLLVYDNRGYWRRKSVVIVQMMQSVAACTGKLNMSSIKREQLLFSHPMCIYNTHLLQYKYGWY